MSESLPYLPLMPLMTSIGIILAIVVSSPHLPCGRCFVFRGGGSGDNGLVLVFAVVCYCESCGGNSGGEAEPFCRVMCLCQHLPCVGLGVVRVSLRFLRDSFGLRACFCNHDAKIRHLKLAVMR